MFLVLLYITCAGVKVWRGRRLLLGKRSTKEVQTGVCVPLYDKVVGVTYLGAAIAYATLTVALCFKLTSPEPIPAWMFWLVFGLPLLNLFVIMLARTVFQEDHFY